MTLAEKILAHHAISLPAGVDGVRTGDVVRVAVDWVIASELSWIVSVLSSLMSYYIHMFSNWISA